MLTELAAMALVITSPAFKEGGSIPTQYTCEGADTSPALIWANVPHYISAAINPKATAAILQRLDSLFDLNLDLGELRGAARRFEEEVSEAVASDPDAAAYHREPVGAARSSTSTVPSPTSASFATVPPAPPSSAVRR